MRCYQCNSAKDANCDSSDAKDLRQYSKLCPLLKGGTYAGNEPIACRKIVQVCCMNLDTYCYQSSIPYLDTSLIPITLRLSCYLSF